MEHHHRHHRAGDVGHHARLLAEKPLEHEELGGEEGFKAAAHSKFKEDDLRPMFVTYIPQVPDQNLFEILIGTD